MNCGTVMLPYREPRKMAHVDYRSDSQAGGGSGFLFDGNDGVNQPAVLNGQSSGEFSPGPGSGGLARQPERSGEIYGPELLWPTLN